MKTTFTVDQKSLIAILSSMQPICTKRTTLDATTSIMFQVGHKELVLKATDLEISLQASYLLKQSSVEEARSFLVSGKRIFDIVKELDGDIVFILDAHQLMVKAGRVNLALNIKDAQEFPPFPERIENLMQLDSAFLLDMLDKVAFLIPQNNANPALNGLYVEIADSGMTMTSTDGHCLAQIKTEKYMLAEPKKWLLPRRAIFEVKKILESSEDAVIFLGVCGNQVVFSGDAFNFFTKLLSDAFPQYASILDRNEFVPASVDKGQFVKTLRRSSCLLSGQFLATKFGFAEQSLNVSMQNKEVGKLDEELSLNNFKGAELDIRFYAPYLLNGLQAFQDDALTFYLKNSSKPIIFESLATEYRFLYLVMPVAPNHAGQS
jgi:DNA polymerase-3 subunit beta